MKKNMINRFISYIKINTQSAPTSTTRPSTKEQLNLLNILEKELLDLGLEVDYDKENGYIYALKKGSLNTQAIGFIAHVDTAPDLSGENVKPKVIDKYDGNIIKLNDEYSLDPNYFPKLLNYIDNTIITTSGDTLLGGDDKAGITIIMETLKYLVENKIEHGPICVAFTTDEEIGTGADAFDVKRFGADFAYTIDGGELGELQFENFNAASCTITINGKNVHPGEAKNKMVNSLEIATDFHRSLPRFKKPEFTEDYEGFYLLTSLNGNVEQTTLSYIIREHDKEKFENMKTYIQQAFNESILYLAPESTIEIKDQYYNMSEKVKEQYHIVELAKEAMIKADIVPKIVPIRGGTDGARLSFMGLLCPNIFTGGHNFHGRYEFISVDSMLKAKQTLINIVTSAPTK